MKRITSNLLWQEVFWARPFQLSDVSELLTHIASLSPRKQIVWEVRGFGGKVRHFIGTKRRYMKPLKTAFMAHGEIEFTNTEEREDVTAVKQLRISKPMLSLKTENTVAVLKTALSALSNTKSDECLTLQIIIGESISPSPSPDKSPNPHATLLDTIRGNIGTASAESQMSIKKKAVQHGFYSVIRIGAKAETAKRTNELLLSIMSAFRQFETAGVNLAFYNTDSESLNQAKIPWMLPLRLSISELAVFVLLPCTDMKLDGVDSLHPKLLRPPFWLTDSNERCFAKSLGASPKKLSIPVKDALSHTVIIGPTGQGKSTVMLNLILEDIKAGRGILVIDPKAGATRS